MYVYFISFLEVERFSLMKLTDKVDKGMAAFTDYVWVISEFIAHFGASYIRGLTVGIGELGQHWFR